ncbi:unnamed protein product [Macrosiphum euphorbiae]|nr:unnamed protein product [Macrosiphum euphorbiae]
MDKAQQQQKQQQVNDKVSDRDDADDVYTAIRRSVVSVVTAAVTSGSLKLRPNCLELFRGTFVLGENLRPWLIDIVSDDPCLAADCKERDRVAPAATRVARSAVQGIGMMLVDRSRGRAWLVPLVGPAGQHLGRGEQLRCVRFGAGWHRALMDHVEHANPGNPDLDFYRPE